MQSVKIGQLAIQKRPGIDTLSYSATIEYTGNVPFTLLVSIYLSDNQGNVILGGMLFQDEREWQPGETNTISGSVTMPNMSVGVYGATCSVARADTSQMLDEVVLPDHIEVVGRKVFGYVRDFLFGLPIQLALVELDGVVAYTNVDGYYEFIDPPWSGYIDITVSATGYASQTEQIMLPEEYESLQVDFDLSLEQVSANIVSFDVT